MKYTCMSNAASFVHTEKILDVPIYGNKTTEYMSIVSMTVIMTNYLNDWNEQSQKPGTVMT